MSIKDKVTLKTYFQTGLTLLEEHLSDLIDSFVHVDDAHEFVALLTQTGTNAPIVSHIITNTLGVNLTFSRSDPGIYEIFFSEDINGANAFGILAQQGMFVSTFNIQAIPAVAIAEIFTSNLGEYQDYILTDTPFFLRIYP